MNVPWWKTNLGEDEANAARDAILAGRLSQGVVTAELEARLSEVLDVPYVTMTTSGSVALASALLSAGIGPGDDVIVPTRTYIATAHAVQLAGANVRLVDTLADTPQIDPSQIEAKITPATKAIIPVHLNGRACDMSAMAEIAERHGLVIIEDAAQALFSKHKNKHLGTFGKIGCFSLGVTKIITSGQGGFIVTGDKDIHEHLQRFRFHGVSVIRQGSYDHFGYNFRYTDIQASIAMKQLDRLPKKLESHRQLYARYKDALKDTSKVKLLKVDIDAGEVPLWIEAVCDNLPALKAYLDAHQIGNLLMTPNLSESRHMRDMAPFPNGKYFGDKSITLPSGPDQLPEHIDRTLEVLRAFEYA